MPYVTDRSDFNGSTYSYGSGGRSVFLRTGSSRVQFGFRSGVGYTPPAPDLPDVTHGPTRKTVLSGLDEAEAYFLSRTSDGWAEHYRTFDGIHISSPSYASVLARRKSASPGTGYRQTSDILCVSNSPSFRLGSPSDKEVTAAAESLSRATVPDRPYTNVMRTLGELRDAPQLIQVANYIPRSTSDLGGAYLNQVFGTQPTIGDMQRLGEVVHRISPAVRDEVANAAEHLRRTAEREFSSDSGSSTTSLSSATAPAHLGPAHASFDVYGMVGGGDIQLVAGISWSETISLRAYGRYTRTVVQMERANRSIDKKLRSLLGSGLSADVIYDLTPYTWLLNWVWDFGSILRYQENLNGADVVAVGHGYNLRHKKRVGWTVSFRENPNGSLYSLENYSGAAGVATRRSDRRQGGTSPYSLTQGSWDTLSGSQWAILAALGLARAPGVPFIKG